MVNLMVILSSMPLLCGCWSDAFVAVPALHQQHPVYHLRQRQQSPTDAHRRREHHLWTQGKEVRDAHPQENNAVRNKKSLIKKYLKASIPGIIVIPIVGACAILASITLFLTGRGPKQLLQQQGNHVAAGSSWAATAQLLACAFVGLMALINASLAPVRKEYKVQERERRKEEREYKTELGKEEREEARELRKEERKEEREKEREAGKRLGSLLDKRQNIIATHGANIKEFYVRELLRTIDVEIKWREGRINSTAKNQ